MRTSLKSVDPVKPVAPYLGGKLLLAKTIIQEINKINHTTYAEPFVGMGGVFFRRDMQPKAEVINDISKDISNLFRILQRHYPEFVGHLRFKLTSRAEFNRLIDSDPNTLTDIERAARFLYLQRTAFGGKVSGRNFGVSKTSTARFNLSKLEPMLDDVFNRLVAVTIECLPYDQFIPRYDGEETLFYLDPPYWNCETDYGKDVFSKDDFERLNQLLKVIKGRFIMSINDVSEIREMFKWAKIKPVKTTYTIAKGSGKKVGELLIMTPNKRKR